jgi:uncharacterized protein (DUF1501 family)
MQRREFLRHLGGLSAGAMLAPLGLLSREAQALAGDYRALVCIFLAGGNDGNNTLVPVPSAPYAAYAAVRGSLALPLANLVQLPEIGGAVNFGLHPALASWQAIWNAGHLAVLHNVGPLVRPMTRAEYRAAPGDRPESLFSHPDQQAQWQTSISNAPSASGWGGRLAEAINGANAGASVPTMISTAGNSLYLSGNALRALSVPPTGSFGIRGIDNSVAGTARTNALRQLLGVDRDAELVAAAQDIAGRAIDNALTLDPILASNAGTVVAPFAGLTSGIARQLLAVAKLIEARPSLNPSRQIFLVSLGGFDTHSNQLGVQANLLGQLGAAVKAFYDAMAAIGENNNVAAFTISDFSRTYKPNTAAGTDHAWGNCHFVIGGAVQGQRFYGTPPVQALNGPDDTDTEGRWIPTTAVDQYAATLATWLGASPASLGTVLPNLSAFASANLGFI